MLQTLSAATKKYRIAYMNYNKLRIGILGASKIAPDAIIEPAKNIDHISVSGIAASNPMKASDYAQKYEIPYSTGDYNKLIKSDLIDVVYVSLKNDMHYEYAIKAIDNKKHVLIEKPICLNYKEYEEIEELALKNNVVVMEAMMVEHHPWQKEILNLIRKKEYGKIKRIVSYNHYMQSGEDDFRIVSKHGGGAIYDLGGYCLQFVQRMIGLEFKTISCQTNSYGPDKIDTEFYVNISTEDDIKVELHGSFIKPFKAHHIVECEKGTIEVKNFFRSGFGCNKMHLHCTNLNSEEPEVVSFEPMSYYHNQLTDLTEAIETGKFVDQLKESGIRVKVMEKLHEIRKITNHQPSGTS